MVSPQRGQRLVLTVILHVGDRLTNQVGVIVKRAHSRIAEEADDSAHRAGLVIVIDLFGLPLAAHGAQAALLPNELVDLVGSHPVAPTEVIVPRAAMTFLDESAVARVVARLAITVVSRAASFVPRKLRDRFGVTTGCAREV